jgi:hypothetical protein
LVCGRKARFGEDLCELCGARSSAVGGGQAWFGPDNRAGEFLSGCAGGLKKRKEQASRKQDPGGLIHR